MDIRQLKYLSAVVNYGDYQLAARSLFISPQGLSKAIRQLENELGLALMERWEGNLAQQMPQLSWSLAVLS